MGHFRLPLIVILVVIFQILCISCSFATGKELNIDSNNLDIDKQKGTAVFSGKVKVVFQDMVLKTEKIEVVYQKDDSGSGAVDRIIIPGKLKAIKNCGKEMALARKGVFYAKKSKLELFGGVILEKEDKVLKTMTLVYYTNLRLKK